MKLRRAPLILALASLSVAGLPASASPEEPAAAGSGAELELALEKLRADDLEGAIAILEPLAERGDASPREVLLDARASRLGQLRS